jgi:uncharacterized protein (TIGR03067 family)
MGCEVSRTVHRFVSFMIFCALGCSGPSTNEPARPAKIIPPRQDDLAKLQGRWIATRGEQGGVAIPAQFLKSVHLRVRDDQYTLVFADQSEKGTLSLDSSKRPKTIDSASRGHRQQGIYELDGDRLKICWAHLGQERPTDLNTKPVNRSPLLGNSLFVFERAK